MPYAYTLRTTIPASAQEIYEAWLDSLAHSEMTGSAASMSDEIDAEVSAWDGYISGRNVELVPGERIVQSWRTTQFTDEHEDSIVTLIFEPTEGGTLVTLMHSNVPDEHTSYELGGWQEHYFEPMQDYFARRNAPAGEAAPEPSPSETEPEPEAAQPAASEPAQPAPPEPPQPAPPRARRARGAAKKKAAAPKAKAAAAKKKSKAAAAKTKKAAGKKKAKRAASKRKAKIAKKTSAKKARAKKANAKKAKKAKSTRKAARGKRR